MKIVFFGTANVALPILEILNIKHSVLAVVTNPDAPAGRSGKFQESPVSALCKDLSLNVLKPEKVKGSEDFLAQLQTFDADIFVVVAYGKILPLEIINLPRLKTINVHFSALPKYRGPSPIQFALLNGEEQTGTSIFILDEKVDNGPLLSQTIVDISEEDNYFTLSDKLAKISANTIIETLEDYNLGKITPLPQDEQSATFAKIIQKQDGKINFEKSATEIYNMFRAFFLWPGIWTTWNGKKLKITDCIITEQITGLNTEINKIGQVLEGGIVVCGSNTFLQIKTLQLEGKNETNISSFLNGYQNFVGSILV
jgi:methionyl-tRNA formyltransferase